MLLLTVRIVNKKAAMAKEKLILKITIFANDEVKNHLFEGCATARSGYDKRGTCTSADDVTHEL
jgi:hypothetical protein